MAISLGGVLGHARPDPLAYQNEIQGLLAQVRQLLSFVGESHFDVAVLRHYLLRNEKRAYFTVETVGRLVGHPLPETLHDIRELMERTLPYDIYQFSSTVSGPLFGRVASVQPRTASATDARTRVEQLHYAIDVRQALLQYVLLSIMQRYQLPAFRGHVEATAWTEAFQVNIRAATEIIQGSRALLRQELLAVADYLAEVARAAEAIESTAEARLGVILHSTWPAELKTLENNFREVLAARAVRLDDALFETRGEKERSGFSAIARQALGGPWVGKRLFLGLLSTAAAATATLGAADRLDTGRFSLPTLPRLQGTSPSANNAPVTPTPGHFSTQQVTTAVDQFIGGVQQAARSADQSAQSRSQVDAFFNSTLPGSSGRQTLVIQSRAELDTLIQRLAGYGYNSGDVLSLLGLASADAFSHPLTLDVRAGQQMPILFPATAASQQTAPQMALPAAPVAVVAGAQTAAMPAALQPSEAYIVYRVQPDEALPTIAARYGTTAEQIVTDNQLASGEVTRGQSLLIRRPAAPAATVTPIAVAAPVATDSSGYSLSANLLGGLASGFQGAGSAPTAPQFQADGVQSSGSFGLLAAPAPAALVVPQPGSSDVVDRYGTQLFSDIDGMPADAQAYLLGTTQEVADFFNVRPGDVLGILRLEQNNAGWRLKEDRVSSAGASGVGQIVARTWNGWANPQHTDYVRNVVDIEEHGGLGFDWASREAWRAWKSGQGDRSLLANSNADPALFENSVAGVARHLVHWGLTRDFAEQDPEGFAERLADAIAVYNSGRTLDESADWTQSSANHKTTAQYVAEAMAVSAQLSARLAQPSVAVVSPEATQSFQLSFSRLYEQSFGSALNEAQVEQLVATNPTLFDDVRNGRTDSQAAAILLLDQIEQRYMMEGRSALQAGGPRPWPFVHNPETLYAQQSAVSVMGRTLTVFELDELMNRTRGERDGIRQALLSRADARLYVQGRYLFDQMLERSERGLPVTNGEVVALVQPLLAGYSPTTLDDATLQGMLDQLQGSIKASDEYQQLHGEMEFAANPLSPMPTIFKGFGVSVSYQAGGRHTGVDLANPLDSQGREPLIYAVDEATVAYVGPLYCEAADACRGGKAIVLDHGNNVFSIYSHNSQSDVVAGQQVSAGQAIGRQGDEGFSYGSHLHFEVHVGAPFTGDWERPFAGGEFVDPAPFLPGSR